MSSEVKRYLCDYCKKKHYKNKSSATAHENRCYWNPKTKSCMTCAHFITGGHYQSRCEHECNNTKEDELSDSLHYVHITNLKHDCSLHNFDGLTLEERKLLVDEANCNAKADWDEYYNSI